MWPWQRDSLRKLSGRLDEVESKVRMLVSEWTDVLDRLERMAGRLAKREQRDSPAVLSGPAPEARGNHAPLAPPASRAMADVMKRRGVR